MVPLATGSPTAMIRSLTIFGEMMQRRASRVSALCSLNLLIARLVPPSGGWLGLSAATRGYRAQATSSRTDWGTDPSLTLLWIAAYTYGQLSRNPPVGPSNVARDSSSPEVDRA